MIGASEFWTDKKVVITGGLGFIGSNLAHYLVEHGASVVIIDAKLPEYGANTENIAGIESQVAVHISDVRNPEAVNPVVESADIVYHFAAQLSRTVSMESPQDDTSINCQGTLNVLQAAANCDSPPKVVFASSQAVVGAPDELPIDESTPATPIDVYGANKRAGELYCNLFWRVHDVPTTVVRLSNVYGPRAQIENSDYGVIHQFLKLALLDQDLTVFEPGDMRRDFVYVEDVVDAFERVGRSSDAPGKQYMVGTGQSITIKELASKIVSVSGSGSVEIVPWPEDWESIQVGDITTDPSTISNDLRWSPTTDLRTGVEKTLEYYRGRIDSYLK